MVYIGILFYQQIDSIIIDNQIRFLFITKYKLFYINIFACILTSLSMLIQKLHSNHLIKLFNQNKSILI